MNQAIVERWDDVAEHWAHCATVTGRAAPGVLKVLREVYPGDVLRVTHWHVGERYELPGDHKAPEWAERAVRS